MNSDIAERTGRISLVKTTALEKTRTSLVATYDQFPPRRPYFEKKEHTETSLSLHSSENQETAHLLTSNPVQQQDNATLSLDISVSNENPNTSIPLANLVANERGYFIYLTDKNKIHPSRMDKVPSLNKQAKANGDVLLSHYESTPTHIWGNRERAISSQSRARLTTLIIYKKQSRWNSF